ncbi:MAG: D-glycerate dehydrogenase, partial [Alphaproteobacteria bacterium]|nr:D-glycerate dehydrogenase [Alphaproteobacteria bacterium]
MAKKPRPAKPRVIVTRRLPPNVEARMAELFDASFNVGDQPMSRTELARAMAQCDVLVPCISDQIDATLIAAAPDRLQLLASFGSGVDHIDLAAARAKGIIVTNTPGVLTEDTADMTMALILSVPRRLAEGEKLVRSGEWRGWSPSGMLGHRIGGKKLGIIGMGRIGRAVARRARAFGLTIAYHNRHRLPFEVEQELEAEWVGDVDGLLAACDIVSIHCPLNGDTRGLIDARRIAL